MIQGGCPLGSGTEGPGYSIAGEFSFNGHRNKIKHRRVVISMSLSHHKDSAGSQFFITVKDAPHLNGENAAFGTQWSGEWKWQTDVLGAGLLATFPVKHFLPAKDIGIITL